MSEERPNYSPNGSSDPDRRQTFLVVTLGYSASVLAYDTAPMAIEHAKANTAHDGKERIVAVQIARTSAGPRPVEVVLASDFVMATDA